MESGFIVYVVDGQKAVFNSVQINDGNWHNLEIIWQNTGGVKFILDYGIRSVVKTLNAKLQGQFVGKIQLGNFNEVENLPNIDENTGFKGCIKVNRNYILLEMFGKVQKLAVRSGIQLESLTCLMIALYH